MLRPDPDQAIGSSGALGLRRMHDDPRDFAVLARWLADDRVLRWYHGRDQRRSLEQIHDMYAPRVRNDDPVTPCIIELEGEPLGYLQFYRIADREKYSLADERDVWALDLFIGEPDHWSCGHGSAALLLALSYLKEHEGARRAVIDPQVTNERAIRSYEKVGFRREKILREHELHEGKLRDHWLMTLDLQEGATGWSRGN